MTKYANVKKWNGKIYNRFVVYFDDVRVELTENEIIDIAKEEIRNKVNRIIKTTKVGESKKDSELLLAKVEEVIKNVTISYINENIKNGMFELAEEFAQLCWQAVVEDKMKKINFDKI